MQRSAELYLAELQKWTAYLMSRAIGRTQQEYLNDLDFQLAVERAFILIGEAMVLLKRHYPEISSELEARADAIAFRNLLVHQYWNIDNREVWTILTINAGPLNAAVSLLLDRLDSNG